MKDNFIPIVEDIKKRGHLALEDIIVRKEAEKFFVDFKLTEKDDYNGQKSLFNSDRKNLAKAISGFGNSEGGIIIWGIDASGHTDDYAKAIYPIKGIDNFKSLLESFVSLSTLPAHKTVESFVVKKTETDAEGVVVTIIPKGDDRPYQNIDDYRYYMRAGDSFVPVPHGVLQGMFGHAPQSDVFYMFNVGNNAIPQITANKAMSWQVGLMAVNDGLGIAEDIYGFARAWPLGDNCQIAFQVTDTTNYGFQTAYGVEFSFMSKQGFRLGHQQRSQMAVMTFELFPPFKREFYLDLLIGARNQQVYRKTIQKKPDELEKIYNQCVAEPTTEHFEAIWGPEEGNK